MSPIQLTPVTPSAQDPLEPAAPQANKNGRWRSPAVINRNNFKFKSLSCWSYNIAIGCSHGCRFCYVPDTSTKKQEPLLREFGVNDADAEWGEYVLLRPWDETAFGRSLRKADTTDLADLNADGNRAVMFCTTTDPYQVVKMADAAATTKWNNDRRALVREALIRIRDHSTLNVRILTRSPLSQEDFDLFRSFGDRLVFGMSLPTLDNDLARIYEPNAPAPSQRLKTLLKAKEAGLNVYVALAPTYPECDERDIRATLQAIKEIDPVTIFHEPINIRAENVQRIEAHAKSLGRTLKTEVFASKESWRQYAVGQLVLVQCLAEEEGLSDRLHLWPDQQLRSEAGFKAWRKNQRESDLGRLLTDREAKEFKSTVSAEHALFKQWIDGWHARISEWPDAERPVWQYPEIPSFLREDHDV